MNLFFDAPSQHAVAERHGLQQLIRSPLAMGLLTGKFKAGETVAKDDIRANTFEWLDYFKDGRVSDALIARLEAVRDLLKTGGRTPAQGALGWLLARSPKLIPVPGAKTVAQAEENAAALDFGPLPSDVMDAIERLIDRPPEGPARER
jgi:aryl-alcohol dehydrogenase-like predicted oxidoreductase